MKRLDKNEFENCVAVKFWLDSLPSKSGPHSTKYVWLHHLKRFCDWIGKSPDQLIEERKHDNGCEDERVKHRAEMKVKQFIKHLEEQGLSANTRNSYFMAIRNFYKRNYYELHFFRGDGPGNQTVQEGTRAASKEDIRKMLEVSNPRVRALLLFIKDTGLAEADVAKLKLKDLGVKDASQIFQLEAPVSLVLRRKKTGNLTMTFMGKESFEALKTTLRIRQQGSPEFQIRRYHKIEKQAGLLPEELTLESPMFRSYSKFFARKTIPVKHLSPHAISVIVRKAAIQAGVWTEGFSAHALRRFFQTSLETSGMNQNWIKKMMGHALGGSEAPYSQPEITMLRDAYQKAYAYLAVSEAVEQKSRVEALESQVEALVLNGKRKDQQILDSKVAIENLIEASDNYVNMQKKVDDVVKRMMAIEKEREELFFKDVKEEGEDFIKTLKPDLQAYVRKKLQNQSSEKQLGQ